MAGDDSKNALTADAARSLLSYDPETGYFRWRKKVHFKYGPGASAGHVLTNGYIGVGIQGKKYLAHRLAWLYMTGEWPAGVVDHINGMKTDNRFANLRVGDQQLNLQNMRSAMRGSKSGLLGASKKRNKWLARISVGGKLVRLGLFESAEEAHAAYLDAKRRLHLGCTI